MIHPLTWLVQHSLYRDQILKELAEDTSRPSLFTDMFSDGYALGMEVQRKWWEAIERRRH